MGGFQQNPYRQANPYGQSPYGQFGPPQRPRRKHHPLRALLFVAMFIIGGLWLLGVIGRVLLGVGSSASGGATEPPIYVPGNTSSSSTTQPTTEPSSSASTPADQGTYLNDDYQVPAVSANPPALPEPQTYAQARQWLTANKLYSQTVAKPVRCTMTDINLETASRAQLQAHLNELTGCLMRVWGPTLKDAGFVAVRPSVTIYSGAVTTKCGKLPSENAVYCGADQQIYYAADLPNLIPSSLSNSKFITESIIAHEFGHAIQARTGILISEQALEEQQSTKAAQYNLSRRTELQADCFAGEFASSIAKSTGMTSTDLTNVTKLFYSFGDDQLTGDPTYVGNHGHGISRQTWMRTGMTDAALIKCNSFSASNSSTQ